MLRSSCLHNRRLDTDRRGRRCLSVAPVSIEAALTALALAFSLPFTATGQTASNVLALELTATRHGQPVVLNREQRDDGRSTPFSISRLDFLLSGLALQREDGTWLESADWFAFFSLSKGRVRALADGLPPTTFNGLRFQVGIPTAQNNGDPAQWPPEHALNPEVNGLHWGWMGGYIFMALEGHWLRPDGARDGFSYHLANQSNLTTIEIPISFQSGGPVTIELELDVSKLLGGVDFDRDGTSTHSREGDPLPAKLKDRLPRAFRATGVTHDLHQETLIAANAQPDASLPQSAQPFALKVTQRFAQVKLPADNPLTVQGVALGQRLFHETSLSINNTQSCASCHDRSRAFADTRRFSLGAEGQVGKRNAMPLFNLAWGQGFFWDGRAATLRDQVLMPVQDPHEMNERLDRVVAKLEKQTGYTDAFAAAFGDPGISSERIAKSLEQYLLTLISQDSKFDRAVRKVAVLSESEKRGLQLFVTEFDPKRGLRGADCFHCHGGTLFTDNQFKNNGLDLAADDLGRMSVTRDDADRGKFKTPSLRNIALTAPYMHDGRFATLEKVVEHYNSGVRRTATLDPNLAKHPDAGLQLTAQDKQDLVAFLKTLTDDGFAGIATQEVTLDHSSSIKPTP